MTPQAPTTQYPASNYKFGSDQVLILIQLWTFLSAAVLIMATGLLWMPPGWSNFPQIPAFSFLVDAPAWLDYVALAGLFIALALGLLSSCKLLKATEGEATWVRIQRIVVTGIVAFGVALILLSQHRLQAWFYQLLVYCLVFLIRDRTQQLRWLRWIVISIYVYSAIGKLDFEFVHTTGQELGAATLNALGLDIKNWSAVDRLALAFALPLTELLLSGLLVWQLVTNHAQYLASPQERSATQRIVFCLPGLAACGFHLLLSGLLLWYLRHSWGVVLWNLQFAVQAILLFAWPFPQQFQRVVAGATNSYSKRFGELRNDGLKLLLIASMVMPIFERTGHWDHWPSWALYAPHSSRVAVSVAPFAVKQLPGELQEILSESNNASAEISIPLSQWSLKCLGVPIYPQSRYQLGVARCLAEQLESRYSISAEVMSPANRFTGERNSILLRGLDSLRQSDRLFWLNTRPRSLSLVGSLPGQPKRLDGP